MRRGWEIVPDIDSIAGSASAGYEYTRKNPIDLSWLDSGGIPSNDSGVPFGLVNGVMKGIWVGSTELVAYDIDVYHHLGAGVSLTYLMSVTVPSGARTASFAFADFGLVSIPQDVQLAVQLVNVITLPPKNLKVYLRPTGDQP